MRNLPEGAALTALRALVVLLGLWFFAAFGLSIYEELRLSSTMPRTPEPDSGFVFPVSVNHGYHVYLDRSELVRRERVRWFFASMVIPVAGALWIQQRFDVFPPYSRRRSR